MGGVSDDNDAVCFPPLCFRSLEVLIAFNPSLLEIFPTLRSWGKIYDRPQPFPSFSESMFALNETPDLGNRKHRPRGRGTSTWDVDVFNPIARL